MGRWVVLSGLLLIYITLIWFGRLGYYGLLCLVIRIVMCLIYYYNFGVSLHVALVVYSV